MPGKTTNVDFKISAQDQASGVFARIGQGLQDLKRQTGSRGPIKDVFEILRGGGAVAGLTFGAIALRDMATEAAKLRDEFNAGKISAGEFVEGIAQGLPVLGRIREAGLAIRELFTGEQAAVRKITEEAERTNRAINARAESLRVMNKAQADHLNTVRDVMNSIALIGTSGPQRNIITAGQSQAGSAVTSLAQKDAAVAGVNAASSKRLTELKAATDAARKAYDEAIAEAGSASLSRPSANAARRAAEELARQRQLDLQIASDAETKETEDRNRKIQSLEREHQQRLSLFARQGNAERLEAAKEFWQKFKEGFKEAGAKIVEEQKKLDKAAREAAMEWGEINANLATDANIQGGRAAGRPEFLRAIDGPSQQRGPTTAQLVQSEFVTGDPGADFDNQQLKASERAAKASEDAQKKLGKLDTIDRTLGEMLRELIRQRQSTGGTSPSF